MRIVHLVEELSVGGLPNYVLQLARLQQPDDDVLVAHMGVTVGSHLEKDGLRIEKVRHIQDLAALKPDLIHIHLLSKIDLLEGLFTLRIPLVRSFHDYTSTCLRRGKRRWSGDRCQRPLNIGCAVYGCVIRPPRAGNPLPGFLNIFSKIAERNFYKKFDALIVGSRHMSGMLGKNGFDSARVYTVPYFSRFADQAGEYPPKMSASGRPVEFLFSGQAVTGKGLEILIRALANLNGNWHLTVFSEGPRLLPAKALAEELGVLPSISFRGWVGQSHLAEAYNKADVFILPSVWDDPGPLVGIEAMAFGTPVVGFAVGGIPDYVIDNKTGFLVNDVSAAGLHKVLQVCLEEPGRLPVLGREAQKLVKERHGSSQHNANIQVIYKDLLLKRRINVER